MDTRNQKYIQDFRCSRFKVWPEDQAPAQELVRNPVSAPPRAADSESAFKDLRMVCVLVTRGEARRRRDSSQVLCLFLLQKESPRQNAVLVPILNSRASGSDWPVRCVLGQEGLSAQVAAHIPVLLAKELKSSDVVRSRPHS